MYFHFHRFVILTPVDRIMFFNRGSHSPTLIDSHAQVESQAWEPELVNQPTPSGYIHSMIFYWSAPESHLLLGEIACCILFGPILLIAKEFTKIHLQSAVSFSSRLFFSS